MRTTSCRGMNAVETMTSIVREFDGMADGEELEADVDVQNYDMGLRVWLLEWGLRHTAAERDDGAARLTMKGGTFPKAAGLHHLVADDDGIVWACDRATTVARFDLNASSSNVVTRGALKNGSHVALDRRANRLVVADPGAGELVAFRADDLAVEQRWKAIGGPQLPLISPDGIICVTGGATGTLTIVRPQTVGFAEQTVEVGPCPHDPDLSSDGLHVFVPCTGSHELVKVRLSDGQIVGTVRVGHGPAHVKADRAAKRVYVANSWDGTVSAVSEDGVLLAQAFSGTWAHAIDLTPDGRFVLVANFSDDTVAVFQADTLERVALLPTDRYPHGLNVSPDGKSVLVTGFDSEYARVYDTATWNMRARVKVGRGGAHTAFTGTSSTAVVSCSVDDHLACIDVAGGTISRHLTLAQAG